MLVSCVLMMCFLWFRPRWVVPVLPKGELEVLLEAAIDLSKKGQMSQTSIINHMIVDIQSN